MYEKGTSKPQSYTIAWDTSTLMASPRNVGRTLLKDDEILRKAQIGQRHISLKEAIPYVEAAAKRLSACRCEYRAGVKGASLSVHTQMASARRAQGLQIATRSQHWSLADDDLKEGDCDLANIRATRKDLVGVSADVSRSDKCGLSAPELAKAQCPHVKETLTCRSLLSALRKIGHECSQEVVQSRTY